MQNRIDTDALLLSGDTYIAYVAADNVQSISLLLDVPAGYEDVLLLYFGEVTLDGSGSIAVHDEVSGVSGGSAGDGRNNRTGLPSTDINVVQDPTFTSDNIHQEQSYAEGGTKRLFDGYRMAVGAGEDLLVEVNAGSTGSSGIRLGWAEI